MRLRLAFIQLACFCVHVQADGGGLDTTAMCCITTSSLHNMPMSPDPELPGCQMNRHAHTFFLHRNDSQAHLRCMKPRMTSSLGISLLMSATSQWQLNNQKGMLTSGHQDRHARDCCLLQLTCGKDTKSIKSCSHMDSLQAAKSS